MSDDLLVRVENGSGSDRACVLLLNGADAAWHLRYNLTRTLNDVDERRILTEPTALAAGLAREIVVWGRG